MKKLIFALLLLVHGSTRAQQINISGAVKDDTGAAVVAATVSLLRVADSSWIRSEITGDDGDFVFAGCEPGNYLLDARALGYRASIVALPQNKLNEELQIALTRTAAGLDEVVVSAKKPFIQTELGKTILNVDEQATASGNILDLLRRAPGVNVDMGENVAMTGKQGVMVYIDDKPVYLTGKDLAAYLKGISENEVAQVELITQPSARYDAAGNEGIINIKTKKNRKDGMNGNLSLSGMQGVYPMTYNSLQVNYRKNKLNLFAAASNRYATGYLRQTIDRDFKEEQTGQTVIKMKQISFMKETFADYNLRFGADYTVSDKTTFGGMLAGIYHPNNETDLTDGEINDRVTNTNTFSHSISTDRFLRKHFLVNAYLKHDFAEGEQLDINADYLHFTKTLYQLQENYIYNDQREPIPGGLVVRSTQPYILDALTAKADYTKTINKTTKLELGIKSSVTTMDNDLVYDRYDGTDWRYDPQRSNHFVYRENINAAYANLNKEIGDKFTFQCGLRAENFNVNGDQVTTGQSFSRSNISLFPTAFTGYKFNDRNQLELNYSRRVERPDYQSLNPYTYYVSQYSYNVGNPNLLPQFMHRIELKHSFRNKLISTLYCNIKKDVINQVQRNDYASRSTYFTLANIGKSTNAGFYATYNLEFFEFLKASIYGLAYIEDFSGVAGNEEVYKSGSGYAFSLDSQVLIGDKWYAEYNMYYGGRSIQSVMSVSDPFISQSFGVSHSFWGDTGTLKLTASDPFNVYRYKNHNSLNNVDSYSQAKYQSQYYALEFRYNFGKKNDGEQRNARLSDEAQRAGM